jgi:choice-of-anchor A domain-containing protein
MVGLAGSASAATFGPFEILSQYNLVTAGDVVSTQEVEGRAYIGGNLSGSGFQVDFQPTAASDFADLIVIGDSSVPNINLQNGSNSDVVIGGVNSSNINNLGGGTLTVGSLPAALVPMFPIEMLMGLSDQFGATMANAVEAVTGQSNLLRLNAAPTGGTTIYNLDIADLNRGGIEVDLNGADLVIVNVLGEGAINSNFQGGGLDAFAAKAIWNFVDAEELEFKQFYGQVLAPFADVTNTSPIKGTLFADNVVLNGEIHLRTFAGDLTPFEPSVAVVPLPAGFVLMIGAFGMLAGVSRKRAWA